MSSDANKANSRICFKLYIAHRKEDVIGKNDVSFTCQSKTTVWQGFPDEKQWPLETPRPLTNLMDKRHYDKRDTKRENCHTTKAMVYILRS